MVLLYRISVVGRKPREIVPGGIYHLIQRGNNKSFIYADANDKHYFLTLLSELQDIQDFSLLFHVLMDNHYHLALQTGTSPDSAPINQIMHQLNMTYSRYYNKLYSRVNTIYGGRYTSKLILDDQHFYRLLRYLAYNPVSAGMVSYPAEYRWSSHAAIRNDLPTPVNKQKILSYFGKDYNQARKRYTAYIEENSLQETSREELQKKDNRYISEYLNYLLESMQLSESVMRMIRSGQCSPVIRKQRDLFIIQAIDAGYRRKDIAAFVSLSYEAVRRIILRSGR